MIRPVVFADLSGLIEEWELPAGISVRSTASAHEYDVDE